MSWMPRACPAEVHVPRYTRLATVRQFPRYARGGFAAAGVAGELDQGTRV